MRNEASDRYDETLVPMAAVEERKGVVQHQTEEVVRSAVAERKGHVQLQQSGTSDVADYVLGIIESALIIHQGQVIADVDVPPSGNEEDDGHEPAVCQAVAAPTRLRLPATYTVCQPTVQALAAAAHVDPASLVQMPASSDPLAQTAAAEEAQVAADAAAEAAGTGALAGSAKAKADEAKAKAEEAEEARKKAGLHKLLVREYPNKEFPEQVLVFAHYLGQPQRYVPIEYLNAEEKSWMADGLAVPKRRDYTMRFMDLGEARVLVASICVFILVALGYADWAVRNSSTPIWRLLI